MGVDISTIAAGCIMALGNVGAVGLLINRTLDKVDATEKATNEHSVLIERAAQNQKQTAETLARVQESVEELYDSRNAHEKELTAVDTLHLAKGCKLPQGGNQR